MRSLLHYSFLPLLLLLVACGGDKGRFKSAYYDSDIKLRMHEVATADDVAAAIASRFEQHDELWVKADVVIRDLARDEKDFFTAKAMFKAPSGLRMSGSRVPIGTIFDLLIVEENAWLTFPREGQQYIGSVLELTEKLGAIGGLGPEQLVAAVLVHQQMRAHVQKGAPYSIIEKDREYFLMAGRDPETLRQFIWLVRRSDGLVEEVLVRSPRGANQLRVRYHEYRMEENEVTGFTEPLPYDFTIYVPRENIMVNTEIDEYRLDRPLPDRAFQPIEAREKYPLSTLRFEEEE